MDSEIIAVSVLMSWSRKSVTVESWVMCYTMSVVYGPESPATSSLSSVILLNLR